MKNIFLLAALATSVLSCSNISKKKINNSVNSKQWVSNCMTTLNYDTLVNSKVYDTTINCITTLNYDTIVVATHLFDSINNVYRRCENNLFEVNLNINLKYLPIAKSMDSLLDKHFILRIEGQNSHDLEMSKHVTNQSSYFIATSWSLKKQKLHQDLFIKFIIEINRFNYYMQQRKAIVSSFFIPCTYNKRTLNIGVRIKIE